MSDWTNTTVNVLTTTTPLVPAGSKDIIILSNNGISDVYLSIKQTARINQGIILGSRLSAISATTARVMFDVNSKIHDAIYAVAVTTTTPVCISYR